LALAFPAAASGRREGTFYTQLTECRQIVVDLRCCLCTEESATDGRQHLEKENTMTYAKPQIVVLGEAVRVIERTGLKPLPIFFDAYLLRISHPAYDLDE
jgi:hypothetical protein